MTADEIGLPVLPLIERAPEVAIPGALSLARYELCDGAILLGAEPLSITMPRLRWSYGILFPIEHAALSGRPAAASCVLRVKLAVEGGAVGVAACHADGSTFTAPETVASGIAEVRLTLTRPAETWAIVVREVGGAKHVCVTFLEIGLFEAGQERLAPRRHDLGYDLFVILSPSKTGTQTIESALYSLSPFARIHRVHSASVKGCRLLRDSASAATAIFGGEHTIVRSLQSMAEEGERVRCDISTVRRFGGGVAFLTAVRDPIERALSSMLQSLPTRFPLFLDLYAFNAPVFAQILAEGLISAWDRELTLPASNEYFLWSKCLDTAEYLNDEVAAVTGFDLLQHDFDAGKGYACVEHGSERAIVFRTSELDRTLSAALREITGHSPENLRGRNIAADKAYAPLYRDVTARLRVPRRLAEAIYRRHAYMKHFFDEIEIERLLRRWSEPRPTSYSFNDLNSRMHAGSSY